MSNPSSAPADAPLSAPRNTYLVPTVIEADGRGERAFDIFSRLGPTPFKTPMQLHTL